MGSPLKRIQYRYDSLGNRSALINHDGGRFTYSYNSVNRITQILNPQGDRTTYSYDAGGRRTANKMANGTRASFTYDAASNLTKLANLKSDGAVISSFEYKYDKVGNRKAVLEADGSRVTWSYDDGYQLTGEHRTGSTPYRDTYSYDPAGNRLLKNHDAARTTYAYDAANQLTYSQDVGGRTTFTFDADGNQQVVREPSGNRTTYAWDYENRMTLARLPAGIRNTMAYDADGLRVKLEESSGTKKFVWDDQNYLGETDASNDTQVIYTNEPRIYGNLVSQRRGSTSHWYHFDALGSTRELTDGSAVVTDTRLYDAWGNAIATVGATVSPMRWVGGVGYYFDVELGQHYIHARRYIPSLALWLSVDPFQQDVGLLATYQYVFNRPLAGIDPSGLRWTDKGEDVWEATADGDTLDQLATIITNETRDWVCIWPLIESVNSGLWVNYPTAKACAKANVSNLTETDGGTLIIAPATPRAEDPYMQALRLIAPPKPWNTGRGAAGQFKKASGQGRTPLALLIIEGHHFGDSLITDTHREKPFAIRDVITVADEKNNATNSLNSAKSRIGPPRCWMMREGRVYGAACFTNTPWATDWANDLVRVTTGVFGTDALLNGVATTGRPRRGRVRIMSHPNEWAHNQALLLALAGWERVDGTQ